MKKNYILLLSLLVLGLVGKSNAASVTCMDIHGGLKKMPQLNFL